MRHTAAVQPDDPTGPSLEKKIEEEERRRNQGTTSEGGGEGGDAAVDAASSGCGSCDAVGCDMPDCDLPGCDVCDGCNLLGLVWLSSLLLVGAAVLPEHGGGALVRMLLCGYRRWLTRFTPACPSTPSCSAYALAAVETRGARAGLVAAAHRIRRCGAPAGG
jgi:Putative membrane protein insertion efficiency factor